MIAVANAGYRAIAIDFGGYGLSEQPAEPEKATFKDLVDDIASLLDSLGINKVILLEYLIQQSKYRRRDFLFSVSC